MITIDAATIQDPSGYEDNYEQFTSDNVSLGLKRQRNRRGKLKWARMFWDNLTPTELNALLDLFQEGDEVAFVNDASSYGTFSFNGIPDIPIDVSEYETGGTYLRSLTVTLREV